MAKAPNGGPFNNNVSGTINNIVIYTLYNQLVYRSKGRRTKPFSAKELAKQQVFKLTTPFFKRFKEYYKIGFALEAEGTNQNAYNKVIHFNKSIVKGDYPNQYIDHASVLVTKGKMSLVDHASVRVGDKGLELSWNTTADYVSTSDDDQVMVLLIPDNMEKNDAFFIKAGALRSSANETISLPDYFRKCPAHVYISFISSDRKIISDSQYLGKVSWEL